VHARVWVARCSECDAILLTRFFCSLVFAPSSLRAQLRSLISSISTLGVVPEDRVITMQARHPHHTCVRMPAHRSRSRPPRSVCSSFCSLPRAQLVYNDSVAPDYEPPGFVAADADALVRSTHACHTCASVIERAFIAS
jgi:hypothetical protein